MGRTTAPTQNSTDHTNKEKEDKVDVEKFGKCVFIYFSKMGRQMVITLVTPDL
jgi:hypothetical protein